MREHTCLCLCLIPLRALSYLLYAAHTAHIYTHIIRARIVQRSCYMENFRIRIVCVCALCCGEEFAK